MHLRDRKSALKVLEKYLDNSNAVLYNDNIVFKTILSFSMDMDILL